MTLSLERDFSINTKLCHLLKSGQKQSEISFNHIALQSSRELLFGGAHLVAGSLSENCVRDSPMATL